MTCDMEEKAELSQLKKALSHHSDARKKAQDTRESYSVDGQ